jgi:uncharacterized membrane protein/uncharacterized protein YegL
VDLKPGRTILDVPSIRLEEGFHEFEAVVVAKDDTIFENNVARGAVRVSGRPKVLVIERDVREARHLEEALAAEEIDVEVRPPTGAPRELNDLLNYDVLVLSDVPADTMTLSQMELIKRYVREMGGGLIMLGGEHSFGLGGYYRTPVEDALPVRMPIRKNIEKPNLALVLVVDKSGSMGGAKIELAKEASIASAEVLRETDGFGLVAFDSLAEWIVPMTDATDAEAITDAVARLVAGGGTNIYPALYEAYQALLDSEAKLKHIILLSDGHTTGGGYEELVSHIAADEITLSTVGVGEDADKDLLESMAEWGGGEAYFTTDFGAIPQIFTRETLRASKSMLIEEPFVPRARAGASVLKGVDLEFPFLLGYVATQKRDKADLILQSDYGDPVLAIWSYGLGRSAAFTSDAKARWAGDWIGWEYFGKLWGQIVRSVMSTGTHKDLRTRSRVSIEGGTVRLTLDVRGRRGEFRDDVVPEVRLLKSGIDGGVPVPTTHLAPGLYQAEFPVESYGEFYRLMILHRRGEDIVDLKALAVTESYSPEFRRAAVDEETLRLLASETAGIYQPTDADLWRFDDEPARAPHETWWWWLLAGLVVLPLDIGVRRTA